MLFCDLFLFIADEKAVVHHQLDADMRCYDRQAQDGREFLGDVQRI